MVLGRYSHPIIKAASELTGIFELKQAGYDSVALKKRFEYYFGKVRNNFSQGKPLKEVKKWKNKHEDSGVLELIESQAEKLVKERIKRQGISMQDARAECLALVGIKHR